MKIGSKNPNYKDERTVNLGISPDNTGGKPQPQITGTMPENRFNSTIIAATSDRAVERAIYEAEIQRKAAAARASITLISMR